MSHATKGASFLIKNMLSFFICKVWDFLRAKTFRPLGSNPENSRGDERDNHEATTPPRVN